jgi:hypothetical protein
VSSFLRAQNNDSNWIRKGDFTIGGSGVINASHKNITHYDLNLSEVTDYSWNFQRGNINQTHQFHQCFSIYKNSGGDKNIYKGSDNMLYKFKWEYAHLDKTSVGLISTISTQALKQTSTGSFADTNIISNLFAPAFINEGIPYTFNVNNNLNISYSPLAGKHTLVMNKNIEPELYNPDSSRIRNELGTSINIGIHNCTFLKIFNLSSHALFFTNYLNDFGKIDVNISGSIKMNITKWLSINYQMVVAHDEDHNVPIASDLGFTLQNSGTQTLFTQNLTLSLNFDIR